MRFAFKVLSILPVLIVAVCVSAPLGSGVPDFRMQLRIEKSEVSKDSHDDTYSITITGRDVAYSWRHEGYPDAMKEDFSYRLSETGLRRLIDQIQQKRLNRNLSEKREIGLTGLSVSVSFEIRIAGATTVARISGMYNQWGAPEEKRCTIVNTDIYHEASFILSSVQRKRADF